MSGEPKVDYFRLTLLSVYQEPLQFIFLIIFKIFSHPQRAETITTKLRTLDCCLAIMICFKFWNIQRKYWEVADTLLVLTDISFSPPSCNYPSTSPEMIGSCYHQTPCDHIYLSFWPRLPFPPSSITSSLQCIIVGWRRKLFVFWLTWTFKTSDRECQQAFWFWNVTVLKYDSQFWSAHDLGCWLSR